MQASYDIRIAAKKIQKWQQSSGLTGIEISKKVGIAPSYYTNIRKGNQPGSVKVLAKICKVLGHDIGELLGHSKKEKEPKISKRELKKALRPVLKGETDNAVDCIEIWLKAPEPLQRALKAYTLSSD